MAVNSKSGAISPILGPTSGAGAAGAAGCWALATVPGRPSRAATSSAEPNEPFIEAPDELLTEKWGLGLGDATRGMRREHAAAQRGKASGGDAGRSAPVILAT